jgi:hypothetical protein
MSGEEITNGKQAALALDAINAYARSSPWEGSDEDHFFFDYERQAQPGADHDRLSGLLCSLMHYAERRNLSFTAALRSARQDYQHQRTAYLPGDAGRRTDRTLPEAAADGMPLIGEIIKATPGSPSSYQVDFITGREWLAEPDLTPSPHFMTISTGFGNLSSAHVARLCLNQIVLQIEAGYLDGTRPAEKAVRDLETILGALSRWCGVARPALLRSFSEVISEKDGWLIAGARRRHPVSLAAVDVAAPLTTSLPAIVPSSASSATVIPFRSITRRQRMGGW